MARTAIVLALALTAIGAGLLPAAAKATTRIEIVESGRGVFGKALQITGDANVDKLTVFQDDQGTTQTISVDSVSAATAGNGCFQAIQSPGRISCPSRDLTQILVSLSSNTSSTPTSEANELDVSRVTQTRADGTPLDVRLNTGPGPDRIVDGDGPSNIGGGAGNDFISAAAGNDDVDDGPGNDVVLAGPGDDRFGDFLTQNSDILSGGPGRDQLFASGTVTLGDLLCNDGSRTDVPVSPDGFARSVAAPEGRLECSGTGADRDLIAGVETVAQRFSDGAVDFTGSAADEVLSGQDGSDRFEGGGGTDSLLGSGGNDLLIQRDTGADARTDCGDGIDDRAVVDPVDPVEPNCENIDRGRAGQEGPIGGGADVPGAPPPAPPQGNQPTGGDEGNGAGGGDNGRTPPEVEIPTAVAFVRRGRIEIRVRCVYRAQNCVGRLTLTAAQSRKVGKRRVRGGQRLATGSVNVPWGNSRPTRLRAPGSLSALLKALRGRTLKVRASVEARDGAAPRASAAGRAARVVTLGFQR